MTVKEIIVKYGLSYRDETTVKFYKRPSSADKDYIVSHKGEIIEELKRRIAELKKAQAEEKAKKDARLEGIKESRIAIEAKYHDGEYLSGYTVFGEEAEMLKEIGAAEYVEGWGYLVKSGLIDALGETFTLAQAEKYMQPENDKKQAKDLAEKAALDAKFLEAKETGKKVEIRRWMSECHDSRVDCDFDMNIEYAMPDGTTKIEWDHCY